MKMSIGLSTRYSCQILMKFDFSRQIFENTQISNFMTIRPVGAELFHADGRTDGQTNKRDAANNRFSQFFERLKTEAINVYCASHFT